MDEPLSRRWTRLDWNLIVVLALFACGIRVWQLTHTVVASRDSIGFIRISWQFRQAEGADWPQVLQKSDQHPLYPLWVLIVSRALEPFHPGPMSSLMQHSAQTASAIMAILLVLPLYALGRELFDRRIGVLSALILQCLPVIGRILSDGLSEATFLFLASSALFWGIVALNQPRRFLAFAWTGLFSAMAYLTRPEGAFIVAATGIMLLLGQVIPRWRRSWSELLRASMAMGAVALVVSSPIYVCTGKLTLKPSALVVIKNRLTDAAPMKTTMGPLFAVWDRDEGEESGSRGLWGVKALILQIGKGSFYVGWLAAVVGLWRYRQRYLERPGEWMLLLVSLAVGLALWRVVVVAGYLSDRHTLLLLTCFIPFAAVGLTILGEEIARRWQRLRLAPLLVPMAFLLVCLPKTLETLHYNRDGFKEAGRWLAEHSHPTDPILDPLCWSHYYAGRVFLEHTHWDLPPVEKRREYIVIEDAGNPHPRVPEFRVAVEKAKKGEIVYRWSGKRGKKHADVLIYALPRPAL